MRNSIEYSFFGEDTRVRRPRLTIPKTNDRHPRPAIKSESRIFPGQALISLKPIVFRRPAFSRCALGAQLLLRVQILAGGFVGQARLLITSASPRPSTRSHRLLEPEQSAPLVRGRPVAAVVGFSMVLRFSTD